MKWIGEVCNKINTLMYTAKELQDFTKRIDKKTTCNDCRFSQDTFCTKLGMASIDNLGLVWVYRKPCREFEEKK